jgi:hypothetical protein
MAGKVRIELNPAAIEELLRSQGVVDELRRRGERVVNAAGEGHELEVYQGYDRARATIRTTSARAARAEAIDRNLTKALDAARGD